MRFICPLGLLTCLLSIGCALAFAPRAGADPIKQDRLIITFWSPPPATDAALAAVAAEGYNLTWAPESGLEAVRKSGLKTLLSDGLLTPATLDNPEQRAKLDALIARVKTHPSLSGYFITDEPSAAAFPGLGRLVAYLREHDPDHYAYINLFPTYANNNQLGTKGDTVTAYQEHLRQYLETVKPSILSYDHYHFFKNGDGKEYFLNLGMIRQAALKAHIPFVNIIQACTIEPSWRLVNADELRFLVYTTLAYGGRGISYFLYSGPVAYGGLYQDGKKTPLADTVANLNREINALSPPLVKLESLGVYHTAPLPPGAKAVPESSPVQFDGSGEFVLGLFGGAGKPDTFMVVNRSYKEEATAKLHLAAGTQSVEEYDRAAMQWKPALSPDPNHLLSVALRPGDGRLFRLSDRQTAEAQNWKDLFDGKSLAGWKRTNFAGGGEVKVNPSFRGGSPAIVVEEGSTLSGFNWTGEAPKTNYEITLEMLKIQGDDFACGLTFPVGDSHASLILGGWGGTVVGISCIDGHDASENDTTRYMNFPKDRWYKIRMRVTPTKLEAWIDDKQMINQDITGKKISLRFGDIEKSVPIGISTFQTHAAFRAIKIRRLDLQ